MSLEVQTGVYRSLDQSSTNGGGVRSDSGFSFFKTEFADGLQEGHERNYILLQYFNCYEFDY